MERETCYDCEGEKMYHDEVKRLSEHMAREIKAAEDRGIKSGLCQNGHALLVAEVERLNTTANDLRAKLAEAQQTIDQLRQRDTVRPEEADGIVAWKRKPGCNCMDPTCEEFARSSK